MYAILFKVIALNSSHHTQLSLCILSHLIFQVTNFSEGYKHFLAVVNVIKEPFILLRLLGI